MALVMAPPSEWARERNDASLHVMTTSRHVVTHVDYFSIKPILIHGPKTWDEFDVPCSRDTGFVFDREIMVEQAVFWACVESVR